MSITSKYIMDHLKFIETMDSDWGKAIAKQILNEAIQKIGSNSADSVTVSLNFSVASYDPQNCVKICAGDGHGEVCTHIGIRL